MVLRKLIIDNSVKCISQIEETRRRDIKTNTVKNKSLPCKQNKNISRSNEKFIKDTIRGEGFKIPKKNEVSLYKKHLDTLIEQTQTKTQETLKFKMHKPADFSFFASNKLG